MSNCIVFSSGCELDFSITDSQSTAGEMEMLLEMLKGKIHRARITQCYVDYEGSLEIDIELLEKAGILPYEKILVVNATNGSRLETYAIPGKAGSGIFCLNGAAAHRGSVGDIITIMCFVFLIKSYKAGLRLGMDKKVLKKIITSSRCW